MTKKLYLAFRAHGTPFHGDSLNEGSLGGSETALIQLSKALARRGHDVKVFCDDCPKPGRVDDVDFLDAKTSWDLMSAISEYDVLVFHRAYQHLSGRYHSKLNVLWNHDVLVNSEEIMKHVWACDLMFCLSQFHKEQFVSARPEIEPLIKVTRNGLDFSSLPQGVIEKIPNLYVWGSRPERGLGLLLKNIWPKILEKNPDAQLAVTWYELSKERLPEDVAEIHAQLDVLVKNTPNVRKVGPFRQSEWAMLLASAQALLYPTQFPEISCINALLAQAVGTPIITSKEFALKETVADKCNLINGNPLTDSYVISFVSRVEELRERPFEYRLSVKKGREHVRHHYEWDTIAEEWETLFWETFEARSQINGGRNTIRQLVHRSDLMAAQHALAKADSFGFDRDMLDEEDKNVALWLGKHHEDPDRYAKGFDEFSGVTTSNYDKMPRYCSMTSHIMDWLKRNGKDASEKFSVVDVGCSDGGGLANVLKTFSNAQGAGIDFSPKLIEMGKKFFEKEFPGRIAVLQCFDFMTEEDISWHSYDVVMAGEWLEHQKNIVEALERLQRMCKPGGLVILSVPKGAWESLSYRSDGDNRNHLQCIDFRDIEEIFASKKFQMELVPRALSPFDRELLGNWVISFAADDAPFYPVDWERKIITARPYQYISACMITRNEEDWLSRCLKSIRSQVDEIVIFDTGSKDGTLEIAKKYADKVVEVPWPDDFAEARNSCISKSNPTADWIYWMDADEVLVNPDRLRKYLSGSLYPGFVIHQNHLVLDMKTDPDTPVRIYRNGLGIKFFGVIHEHCEFALNKPIEPILILPDVDIAHYGYLTEGVRRDKCQQRNLPLLKKDREKYPERVLGLLLEERDFLHMAQWYLEEAHGVTTDRVISCLREVVNIYLKYFSDEKHRYHTLSFKFYQCALEALGRRNIPAVGNQVPVQIAMGLGGSVGGMQNADGLRPHSFWFSSTDEMQGFIKRRGEELSNITKSKQDKTFLPQVKAFQGE